MKFQFNTRDYQEQAIQSVVRLFEGQPTTNQKLDISYSKDAITGYGNQLFLEDNQLLKNLQAVQKENHREDAPIGITEELTRLDYSIEMETGTGKTFVYLKTIVELAKTYGWKKYIVVVPSVAIKEGVKSEFDRLKPYLEAESKLPILLTNYDSKNINDLETYYRSNMVEILLMTMQSFNSDNNVLNKTNYDLEVGKPIRFIQELNPIVILDEPQKMEGDATQNKLKELHPLFMLRYSATHKDLANPIYRYTPIDAYQDRYVKKIEVLSVYGSPMTDIKAFVEVEEIDRDKTGNLYAKLKFYQNSSNGVKFVSKKVKNGFDLYVQSKEMVEYKGYKVQAIDYHEKMVRFENEIVVKEHELTQNKDEVMKVQIRETIESHLQKELDWNKQGIKVLSLFFIDKVVNYRNNESEDGKGKIRKWFEEAYQELTLRPKYKVFATKDIDNIQAAYFSQDKSGVKDTRGNTKADEETYDLIMRKKEELLSLDNPKRFIFSHSALREGWDNPNVFQICTLNETKSETRKRQEIGRGLRLPVNQEGKRIQQEDINILTVVANEAYETFAKGLQHEIEEETGLKTTTAPVENGRDRVKVKLRRETLEHPEFKKLWKHINKKTIYSISLDDKHVIEAIVNKIREEGFYIDPIPLSIKKIRIESMQDIEKNRLTVSDEKEVIFSKHRIPNIVKRIADNTGLTKKNVVSIIQKSEIQQYIFIQPDTFIEKLSAIIKEELPKLLKDGIKYEPTQEEYDISLFKEEIKVYKNNANLAAGLNTERTLYDTVQLDSYTELKLIEEFNANLAKIKFYTKLPNGFKVKTPAGNYNPDWAIVFENDEGQDKLYLVRESKNTKEPFFTKEKLKTSEQQKIEYAKKHFDSIAVDYQVIEKFEDISKGVYPFGGLEKVNLGKQEFIEETLKKLAEKGIDYSLVQKLAGDQLNKYNITYEEYKKLLFK